MAQEILVTPEGLAKLKAELDELEHKTRLEVADAIREAKSHGDLKENAAYHEAKLNQTRLEQRIGELRRVILNAKIVERKEGGGTNLGSVITLLDLEFDDQFDVTLVGAFEADPQNGRVSVSSPLGAALIGTLEGAEITVDSPGGLQKYRILKVV